MVALGGPPYHLNPPPHHTHAKTLSLEYLVTSYLLATWLASYTSHRMGQQDAGSATTTSLVSLALHGSVFQKQSPQLASLGEEGAQHEPRRGYLLAVAVHRQEPAHPRF
jgi:hypothetical protein